MATFGALKVVCVVLVLSMVVAPLKTQGLTCGRVASSIGPCVAFLRGHGGLVPRGCCSGIRSLNSAASTTADRQTVCRCLKTISSSARGINYGLVASLPGRCGVSIPYKIIPSTNCDSVK